MEITYEKKRTKESKRFGKLRERIRKVPTPKTEFQIPTSKYLVVTFTGSLLVLAFFMPRFKFFPAGF